jgi:CubicO group peptidase (beta-lactamase class C family)
MLLAGGISYGQTERMQIADSLAKRLLSRDIDQVLAIGIIDQGKKQVLSFGQAYNSNNQQVAASEAIFEIGELSSLFTTTLLARMAIDGQLALETPIQTLMPHQRLPVYQKLNCEPVGPGYSIYACDPKSDDETISILLCNLATHTAGFPTNPVNLKLFQNRKNPYARYTKEHLYRYLNNTPLSFTSGFDYRYSHIGMALLGHSLSLKASLPYEKLLNDKLLKPLSLQHTYLQLPLEKKEHLVQGYSSKGKATPHWDFDILAPSAGMSASLDDMLQFLSVHMGYAEKEWLPTVRLAQNPRETIQQKEMKGTRVGLGWLLSLLPGSGEEVIWMEGKTGGFASYIGFTGDYSTGIVILTNQSKSVAQLGQQLLRILPVDQGQRTVHVPALIK